MRREVGASGDASGGGGSSRDNKRNFVSTRVATVRGSLVVVVVFSLAHLALDATLMSAMSPSTLFIDC